MRQPEKSVETEEYTVSDRPRTGERTEHHKRTVIRHGSKKDQSTTTTTPPVPTSPTPVSVKNTDQQQPLEKKDRLESGSLRNSTNEAKPEKVTANNETTKEPRVVSIGDFPK